MNIKFLKAGRWRKAPNTGEPIQVSEGDVLDVSPQTAEYAINSGCAEMVKLIESEPEPESKNKSKRGKRKNPAQEDRESGEREG